MKDVAWAILMLGSSFACAEASNDARVPGGLGGVAGAAGSAGALASGGAAGTSASAGGSGGNGVGGAAEGAQPELRLGEPLELVTGTGELPYAIGPNPYGIRGGGFVVRSELGNTISVAREPGQICISGSLDEVPNADYSRYWGVEVGFNLNQGVPGEAGPASADGGDAGGGDGAGPALPDAGGQLDAGDAAPAPEVARPWLPGNVIGFAFVIEGPTINPIRFKGLPTGYDPELESSVFCKNIAAISGERQTALFSEVTQYCWSSQDVPIPAASGLSNISWQLNADVAPAGARPFDWCLKELRPILAP